MLLLFQNQGLSMSGRLSIRSYSRQRQGHSHTYHQMVLPLRGAIEIELDGFAGRVASGECVVIRSGQQHHFTADEEAWFVVADMHWLPENLRATDSCVFRISGPLLQYLSFVETQLGHQVNDALEQSMFVTFALLLAEQRLLPQVDRRIRQVLQVIDMRLSERLTLDELAQTACLSETQLKKLFRQQIGLSVMQYLTRVRMEKAKALLQHTDYSVQRIAEQVGYSDLSAFSRRFSASFGLSPTRFSR